MTQTRIMFGLEDVVTLRLVCRERKNEAAWNHEQDRTGARPTGTESPSSSPTPLNSSLGEHHCQ